MGYLQEFFRPKIFKYKYNENSQKNGKIWINKVSVWY